MILITGAAGQVATMIRPRLLERGHRLRVLDTAPIVPSPGEDAVEGSVTDMLLLGRALQGVDLVVHLAGHAMERAWEDILDVNVTGARAVLEAAREAGVGRVLLASSIHAVGMLSAEQISNVVEPTPHPDTYYGWSKAAVEALGRLYADRFGMTVVSARIGTAAEMPPDARALSTWLSPDDMVRIVEAALTTEVRGGHVIWGVSRNTSGWASLEAGREIGYDPIDDAERHRQRLGGRLPLNPKTRLGGAFTDDDHPIGTVWNEMPARPGRR
ncbi:NAD(P)-dependent oxidoreductase [Okibacterium endophyticum]